MHEHRFLIALHNLPGPSKCEGPRQFSSFADTDADGITDNIELMAGADPLDADEDGDGVPDGMSMAAWADNALWASNASESAYSIAITMNSAVPAGASASLVVGSLCIPLRSPGSWTLGLVPGERYPYRLNVGGDVPVSLSIGPGGGTPPMRGSMNAMSIALWVDGMGGTFELRGRAMVDGRTWTTPISEIEVQFPSFSDILENGIVSAAMDNAWQMTKDGCTENPNQRHEVGFWIQLNTYIDSYVIGTIVEGLPSSPGTSGHLQLPGRPADSPSWIEANASGAVYTVGVFHTHTPRTYLSPTNEFRRVGPSATDVSTCSFQQLPGFVYDYVGSPDPNGNPTNRLYNGHPKDSPACLYPIAPLRRPTP